MSKHGLDALRMVAQVEPPCGPMIGTQSGLWNEAERIPLLLKSWKFRDLGYWQWVANSASSTPGARRSSQTMLSTAGRMLGLKEMLMATAGPRNVVGASIGSTAACADARVDCFSSQHVVFTGVL